MQARASRFPRRCRITGAHCRHEEEASRVGTVVRVVAAAVRSAAVAVAVPARLVVATVEVAAEARVAVVTEAEEEGAPVDPVHRVHRVEWAAAGPPPAGAAITKDTMKSSR